MLSFNRCRKLTRYMIFKDVSPALGSLPADSFASRTWDTFADHWDKITHRRSVLPLIKTTFALARRNCSERRNARDVSQINELSFGQLNDLRSSS